MEPPNITAEASEGLSRAGQACESRAKVFLESKLCLFVKSNFRVCGVQLDLLMRRPNGRLLLVEVKSQGALSFGVLSQSQLKRLKRAQMSLSEREPVELLVLVEDQEAGFLEIPIED